MMAAERIEPGEYNMRQVDVGMSMGIRVCNERAERAGIESEILAIVCL